MNNEIQYPLAWSRLIYWSWTCVQNFNHHCNLPFMNLRAEWRVNRFLLYCARASAPGAEGRLGDRLRSRHDRDDNVWNGINGLSPSRMVRWISMRFVVGWSNFVCKMIDSISKHDRRPFVGRDQRGCVLRSCCLQWWSNSVMSSEISAFKVIGCWTFWRISHTHVCQLLSETTTISNAHLMSVE